MLDGWIIEQIEQRDREEERPFLELPLYPVYDEPPPETKQPETERGVIIIDL
jgi:hypothetical protein